MATKRWIESASSIRGVLLDITGVLYESGDGDGRAITGSVDAVNRLRQAGLPVHFCTNETQCTRKTLVDKLTRLGFTLSEKEVFPPIPAVCRLMKERKLRPHLLVHPASLPDYAEVDQSDPNCVVVGDAAEAFTYENVNDAFQLLIGLKNPVLFALGKGRFYSHGGRLNLDVGAYMKALEYACDIQAEIVGKPSNVFFQSALADMGVSPENALMVGDDIVSDVGGAQNCGLLGVLVRTGKYRRQDETHATVKPDLIVDDLSQAVDMLLRARR